MKKGKILYILIIPLILVIAVLFGVLTLKSAFTKLSVPYLKSVNSGVPFNNSPLDKYDFTNCKIKLHGNYLHIGIVSLTEEQKEKFLEMILNADIDKYNIPDFPGYIGGPVPYEIELGNGETVKIHHEGGPHLTIGEKTYKCYSEDVLDFLDKLADEIYRENYPDKD